MTKPRTPDSRKQYGLRLRLRLMKDLAHIAVEEERNLNDLVEEAIEDLLVKHQAKRKKQKQKQK